jgi:cell division protein FtsL
MTTAYRFRAKVATDPPAPQEPVRLGPPRPVAAEASRPVARPPAAASSPVRAARRGAQSRGPRLLILAALALSLLGVIYLLQISRVASYGYELARIQQRQAELDRENELLLYRLSEERRLERVDDLARRDYGMQPLDPGRLATATATAAAATTAASGAPARPTQRYQFIGVQRPPAAPPTSTPTPRGPTGILDRLWQRVVGIGVAGEEAR